MRRSGSGLQARRIPLGALVLVVMATLGWSAAAPAALAASTATITGSFGDSCRDFQSHSSKDISHVELHYADGRVVKDEAIESPDFAIDGAAGDEIDFVGVKSGRTTDTFNCPRTNSPPTAVLEILTPSDCVLEVEAVDHWRCPDASAPRTTWLSANTVGFSVTDCSSELPSDRILRFRGTSSTDPDNDITSWSIEFDYFGLAEPTSTSGDWIADPPADVTSGDSLEGVLVTLTVTDSAGQSDSDTMGAGLSGGCD
jgi:hypothetical protein